MKVAGAGEKSYQFTSNSFLTRIYLRLRFVELILSFLGKSFSTNSTTAAFGILLQCRFFIDFFQQIKGKSDISVYGFFFGHFFSIR